MITQHKVQFPPVANVWMGLQHARCSAEDGEEVEGKDVEVNHDTSEGMVTVIKSRIQVAEKTLRYSVKQQSIRKDKKDAIVNDDNSEWMEKYRVAEKCYMFIKFNKLHAAFLDITLLKILQFTKLIIKKPEVEKLTGHEDHAKKITTPIKMQSKPNRLHFRLSRRFLLVTGSHKESKRLIQNNDTTIIQSSSARPDATLARQAQSDPVSPAQFINVLHSRPYTSLHPHKSILGGTKCREVPPNKGSSIDLFTSRLIQEKCREQQHFIILIRSLRDGTEAAVQFKGSLSDKFAVHNCLYTLMAAMANACEGVKVGRRLTQMLFAAQLRSQVAKQDQEQQRAGAYWLQLFTLIPQSTPTHELKTWPPTSKEHPPRYELISGSRPIARLLLHFHDKVKRDMNQLHLDANM
ncbi:unnamed protein product [Clavelina lepadiformis]|uniref:Uncharacterized protein n=1 Tax=Clavelina lepadiformis TaxID=159417 RepID=A0ABP0GMD4_CLALP